MRRVLQGGVRSPTHTYTCHQATKLSDTWHDFQAESSPVSIERPLLPRNSDERSTAAAALARANGDSPRPPVPLVARVGVGVWAVLLGVGSVCFVAR